MTSKKKYVKEFEPIEIKEPFKTDIIEFDNPMEFTKYYREHQDEFNNMTTYKLNMRYKIPGYKISQSKGNKEIRIVKDYSCKDLNEMNSRKDLTEGNTRNPNNNNQKESEHEGPNALDLLKILEEKLLMLTNRILNIENYLSNE